MPRLRDTTRLERRRSFVEGAWRRAASQGWRDMTVDDVCAEAGLSKGAFYSHFDSKRALLEALVDDDASAVTAAMDRLEARDLDGPQRLRQLTQMMVARAADPARVQIRADLWAAVLTEPEIRQRVNGTVDGQRRVIRRWVEEAIASGEIIDLPANALASVLLGLNDGLMLHRAVDDGGFRWANISRVLDALLTGIATR
ncbi:MAG: TetR/AcrR family transcriptional regulator [Candidatus Dormiibacterota bacterium]